jgi:hypothetical protein
MNNLFNRPPFSTIKKKIENTFGDSQEAVYRTALSGLLALTLSGSALASNPESPAEKKDIAPTSETSKWKKDLAAKCDSLSHEIVNYEQSLLDRAIKGTPYEVRDAIDGEGNKVVVKSFRVSAPEGRQTGTRVDITYRNESGVEMPIAIAVTKYDSKSQQQITVVDGAYDRGIIGQANYIRVVDSQGKESAVVGFVDQNKDGLYEIVGTVQPVAQKQVLEAYVNAQVLYDRSLKDVLHVPQRMNTTPDQVPQKIQPQNLPEGMLSQNIDN